MNRLFHTSFMAIVFLSFFIYPSDVSSAEGPPKEVVAVVLSNWPPQYATNKDTGNPEGFAIDIMNRVAELSGLKVRYIVRDSWPDAFEALRNKQAVLSPNMGRTDERLDLYDFTTPYETFRITIFVRDVAVGIDENNALAGKNVGVVAQNQGLVIMRKRGGSNLRVFNSMEEAFMALLAGTVDALVYPEKPLVSLAIRSGLAEKIKIVGKPLQEIKRGIAVRKGEPELFSKLDTAIQQFIKTPEYQRIYEKWYGKPEPFWNLTRVIIVMGVILALTVASMLTWRYLSTLKLNRLLSEAEGRFRGIVENTDAGYFFIDTEGIFQNVNRAWLKMHGYDSRDEIIGQHYTLAQVKEDIDAAHEKVEALLVGHPILTDEFTRRCKDGTVGYHTFSAHPVVQDGRVIGLEGFIIDTTERKRAEQELRENEERFRFLTENIADIVWTLDLNFNTTYVSPSIENILGFTPSERLQQTLEEMITPESIKNVQEIFLKEFQRDEEGSADPNRTLRIEVEYYHKDGHTLWMENIVKAIRDPSGLMIGMLGVSRDLTERKEFEEKLRRSKKMEALGTLSGGIAHEFNNILGIIIGNAELALDDVPEWNPAKDCLDEIRTASLRAKDVVRQIMSFSRKTPATRKPIKISKIIQEFLKLMRSTIPTNIDIRQEILCKDEMILANPTEISQILMNLCSNAVHAMEGDTGWLKVRLETTVLDDRSAASYEDLKSGEYVKLTIKDCGYGIDPKIKGLIFDPYFTTKDVDKGLGMGLAVVYGIVKKHDGAIRVNSKVGKGTTVEVLFPITKETAQIEAEVSKDFPRGTERILFVDDEASLVKLVTQMLERQGYEVVGTTSSTEALKLFQEKSDKFDLVISDMAMPELPGDRLAQEIIKIRPTIPVVICTGHSDRMDEGKALKFGIAAYAMKPLVKTDLVETVRRVLDKSKGLA